MLSQSDDAFFNDPDQYYKRTPEVEAYINQRFKQLSASTEARNYLFTGSDSYGFFFDSCKLHSQRILSMLNQIPHTDLYTDPIRVLDVGAGNYAFVDQNQELYDKTKIEFYGITDSDNFRKLSQREIDEHHIIGDAECLSGYVKNQFDYVFSCMTYRHLIDPVGSLIEAYKVLKPGGVLMIDQFIIKGCESYTQEIISYLIEHGYEVVVGSCPNIIDHILIKKPSDGSNPELKFPVLVDQVEKGVLYYRPTKDLLSNMKRLRGQENEKENKWYQSGCEVDIIKARKINENLFNRCNSLLELFKDEEYLQLSSAAEQHLFIRAIVAKTKSYNDLDELYRLCKDNDIQGDIVGSFEREVKPHIYKHKNFLYSAGNQSGDPMLGQYAEYADDHPDLRMAMCEQQLRIITYAAMIGIILDQKMLDTKAKLESMHFPVETSDSGARNFQRINIKKQPGYALTFSQLVESYDNNEGNSLSNSG